MLLLDFIRYHQQLNGTKIGCREGDCGACTVLTGEIKNGELVYRSATSCLVPLGNAQGKHIVTVEGVNVEGLNFIQQCFADEGATQCGFCTPGFVVSLAGFCLDKSGTSYQQGINAVNGNICRCTGYKSIERAIATITGKLSERSIQDTISYAVENNILPGYFHAIKKRLAAYAFSGNGTATDDTAMVQFVAGGTDLYVQQPAAMLNTSIGFLFDKANLNGIFQQGNRCIMGGSVAVTDVLESSVFQQYFPGLPGYIKLVASTPVRNMATIAGNFINASPIGDFTIFFLALNAQILLRNGNEKREIPLRKLYKGYKSLDKKPEEFIEQISFELPGPSSKFNFEKVSKRTHLDIASVNTAIHLIMHDDTILSAGLSAGGVGPVPAYLERSAAFLTGKILSAGLVSDLLEMVQTEISPISDARGTETYKRLLLGQLIKAHFISLFPSLNFQKLMTA